MTRIYARSEIESAIANVDLISVIERAFVDYSEGRSVIPPVGELIFEQPPGDAHIKYGYVKGDDTFVIKVATGFYDNPQLGLPATSGLMLVFSQHTGMPLAVLLDEGELTNLRTAAAGAIAAKHLAHANPTRLCVLGAGVQARMQMKMLAQVTACRKVTAWARRPSELQALGYYLEALGFAVTLAKSASEAAKEADIVVTTTAACEPLLGVSSVKPGTHITAVGSDTPTKQELTAQLVTRADVIVADSRSQCMERGEIHHAITKGGLIPKRIVELGEVIAGRQPGRTHAAQISIADLTGVAVQDIAISQAVLAALGSLRRVTAS